MQSRSGGVLPYGSLHPVEYEGAGGHIFEETEHEPVQVPLHETQIVMQRGGESGVLEFSHFTVSSNRTIH